MCILAHHASTDLFHIADVVKPLNTKKNSSIYLRHILLYPRGNKLTLVVQNSLTTEVGWFFVPPMPEKSVDRNNSILYVYMYIIIRLVVLKISIPVSSICLLPVSMVFCS